MCNLYSATTNQEAIRNLFKVGRDLTGNIPPLPGIFPDYPAPIVRVAAAVLASLYMRLPTMGSFAASHRLAPLGAAYVLLMVGVVSRSL